MSTEWMPRGLCRTPSYQPLFADQRPTGMSRQTRNEKAKGVCRRCTEVETCLAWALEQEGTAGAAGRAGILGGHTAKERAEIAGADTADELDEDGTQ